MNNSEGKMNVDNLITKIADSVQLKLGNGYCVSTDIVTKNNDLKLCGLYIRKKGRNISPVIYIDEFMEYLRCGASLDAVTEKIIEIYRENIITNPVRGLDMADFDSLKHRIIFQLINTRRNKGMLKDIPSIPFLDLSIIFKVLINTTPCETATLTIKNEYMEMWHIGTEQLFEAAMANTPRLQEYDLKTMGSILAELTDHDFDDGISCFMYVLSNKQRLNGCGCILYPDVLESIAEKIGNNFYILPSSIHEVIIVPDDKMGNAHSLIQIVREVNKEVITQEDFLSDNVYFFSGESRKINLLQ